MADSKYGPWKPMSIGEAVALFSPSPARWYVSGGLALEIFTSRSWRIHDDLDLGVLRGDVPALRTLLLGWDVRVAAAGTLTPWDGRALVADSEENNLWVRQDPSGPWRLDIQIGDGNDDHWIFRRDPSITLTWEKAVNVSKDGVPYLAPEIQLLFKSKNVRPKDDIDAREVIPELDSYRRSWLGDALPTGHKWHEYLRDASKA